MRWSKLLRKDSSISTPFSIMRLARRLCADTPRKQALRRGWSHDNPSRSTELGRRRRQEMYVVLGGELYNVVWILLLHIVNSPEQVVESAGRGHPEQHFC